MPQPPNFGRGPSAMCHVHIANQAVAAVENRTTDCAAFRICLRARCSASNLRIFVRSNGIVRPQKGLSTQNAKTFWHHSSIQNSRHVYSLKTCKPSAAAAGFQKNTCPPPVFGSFSRSRHATTSFNTAPVLSCAQSGRIPVSRKFSSGRVFKKWEGAGEEWA